jgi:hypothetical protein
MKLRRTLVLLAAGVAASAGILFALPSAANAAVDTENYHELINYGSGKCFAPTEPSGHWEWAGDPVQQGTCGNANPYYLHFYKFVSLGAIPLNGEPPWYCPWCDPIGRIGFHIVDQQTGQCLDARDGATTDWSVVQQWTCKDYTARSMLWWLEQSDIPGMMRIVNFNSELCMDVANGSWADGAQLQQYHCTSNNSAQAFYQSVLTG